MQNRMQNHSPQVGLSAGAGDGDRTHDIQLGNLNIGLFQSVPLRFTALLNLKSSAS